MILLHKISINQAELNKLTAENGSVETGSLVGTKFEDETKSDNPKHHLLLLQVLIIFCLIVESFCLFINRISRWKFKFLYIVVAPNLSLLKTS